MKITAFNKTVEIDETNKGIAYFFKNVAMTVNEITITFWYRMRHDLTTEEAAEILRNQSDEQFKETVLQSIKDELHSHNFSKKYADYVM